MSLDKLLGRGIAFPPTIDAAGRLAMSEGLENIDESIRVMLMTEPGERPVVQEFGGGLGLFLFEPNTPATRRLMQEQVTNALQRWERRIHAIGVNVVEAPGDPQAAVVTIQYECVVGEGRGEVSLRVQLGG